MDFQFNVIYWGADKPQKDQVLEKEKEKKKTSGRAKTDG